MGLLTIIFAGLSDIMIRHLTFLGASVSPRSLNKIRTAAESSSTDAVIAMKSAVEAGLDNFWLEMNISINFYQCILIYHLPFFIIYRIKYESKIMQLNASKNIRWQYAVLHTKKFNINFNGTYSQKRYSTSRSKEVRALLCWRENSQLQFISEMI